MSIRDHAGRARWGLAATLGLGLALAGCGDGGKSGVESAQVVVPEPSATASTSASPATAATAPAGTAASGSATASESAKPAETSTAASPAPAAGASAAGWGTLKGRVVFSGDIPKAKVLVAKGDSAAKDPQVCAKKEIDSEKLVVDPASKGVSYAIVYIPKPTAVNPEATSAAKAAEVVFDQKNCMFVPHVLAAMKGATVTIKSSDPVGHNANAVGLNNNKFNLPTAAHVVAALGARAADKPGKVECDIHSWMEAYWLVLDNPYFAVTDDQGNFEIKNAPAGDQKVVVWAEALGARLPHLPLGRRGRHQGRRRTTKDFTLDAAKVK